MPRFVSYAYDALLGDRLEGSGLNTGKSLRRLAQGPSEG